MKKNNLSVIILILTISFFGCQKSSSLTSPTQVDKPITDSARAFLLRQKSNLKDSLFIDTLFKSASWNQSIIMNDTLHKQNILYIPVKYNANTTNLVFELDYSNSVQDGYIADIPTQFSTNSIRKFISVLYNHEKTDITANVSAYNFRNLFLWEVGFKNGNFDHKQFVSTKTGTGNKESKADGISSCTDYYLVTYWSDGSSDWDYIGTACTGCALTKQMSRDASTSTTLNCPGSGGGGTGNGGGGSSATVSTSNPNKMLAMDCQATIVVTKLPNGKLQISFTNTGMFVLASVTITFVYDPVTKLIDPTTVKSVVSSGVLVGSWTQTKAYGTSVTSSGNDSFVSIDASVAMGVPGTPFNVLVPYTINIDLNLLQNTAYIKNIDHTPFKL